MHVCVYVCVLYVYTHACVKSFINISLSTKISKYKFSEVIKCELIAICQVLELLTRPHL